MPTLGYTCQRDARACALLLERMMPNRMDSYPLERAKNPPHQGPIQGVTHTTSHQDLGFSNPAPRDSRTGLAPTDHVACARTPLQS